MSVLDIAPQLPPERVRSGLYRPLPLLGYIGLWLLLGLWLGSNGVLSHRLDVHPPADWEIYTWELTSALVVGTLALPVARFEARWRVTGPGLWRRLPLHLPAAVAFSAAHVSLMVALRQLVYAAAGHRYDFGDPLSGFFYEFQKDLITYVTIIAACVLVRVVRERRRQQIRELQLRQAATDARLAHLSAQIEPHFIFNTLNAIANRMYEDVAAADRMLVALADLLRAAMARGGTGRVTVAEDLHWLEAYCHLMAERQPGRLQVDIAADPAARRALIPRLLLQPLVENAFRHGLRSGRGRLEVAVRSEGGWLHCRIADDGVGLEGQVTPGLGLENVRERLALLYPHRHRLRIAARPQGGTEVVLELPLEYPDDIAPGHR